MVVERQDSWHNIMVVVGVGGGDGFCCCLFSHSWHVFHVSMKKSVGVAWETLLSQPLLHLLWLQPNPLHYHHQHPCYNYNNHSSQTRKQQGSCGCLHWFSAKSSLIERENDKRNYYSKQVTMVNGRYYKPDAQRDGHLFFNQPSVLGPYTAVN